MFNKKTATFSLALDYKKLFVMLGLWVLLSIFVVRATIRFNFNGNFEGLYLLKGANGRIFELKDDILLGEYHRLLFKMEFGGLFSAGDNREEGPVERSYLRYKWHAKTGDGYVINFFPDGTKFMVSFARFLDSNGTVPEGLFVGGGLPYSAYEHSEITMNETGVAFFNGRQWHHLWCNVNEAIIPASTPQPALSPSQWGFLGSKVLFDHNGTLILKSSHGITIDGVPLRIDRFAFYKTGNRFFTLVIRIKNAGQSPVGYHYVYGDEPWVGDYGSSRGNVGWTKDRIYYYEGRVDTQKNSYAGMFDYGNKVLPEERDAPFTGLANFIQWMGEVRPDLAYFSNRIGLFASEKDKVPLSSGDSRVLFLEWGPRVLQPSQADIIMLAIGMADNDPKTGLPVKPQLLLSKDDIDYVIMNSN